MATKPRPTAKRIRELEARISQLQERPDFGNHKEVAITKLRGCQAIVDVIGTGGWTYCSSQSVTDLGMLAYDLLDEVHAYLTGTTHGGPGDGE